ncbi:hypothetical protein F53441_1647 [Fusarium austroafricanum]|uniref:Nephrocystin 3-like N-terminal domain-containing protein n=1 Tax=Fusarium austroafricanum TaxID=2364996 RepID=A0A8H4KVP7_9HYPO|nr:hypothetical protein F53441_1647 [Fusarium austroafricanum]
MFHRFQRSASSKIYSTPTTATSSLIYQLLGECSSTEATRAAGRLATLATRFPMGPQYCPFEQLWNIFEDILSSEPGWRLIVDALDECTFDGPASPAPLAFLQRLHSVSENTATKILVFSRPDSRFDPPIETSLFVYLDDKLLLHDVMTFAEAEYEKLDLSQDHKALVMQRVRSSSEGSFWWVKLFLNFLSRALQVSEFNARLDSLAPSISDFYEAALLHPTPRLDKDETKCRNSIFLLSLQAQRTLLVSEIGDALSLRPDRAEAIISRLCQPLVSTRGGVFQLSHPSVREYFETHHEICEKSLGLSFSASHAFMAEKCLSCLVREEYGNLENLASFLKATFNRFHHINAHARPATSAFYAYASRYWHYHLIQVNSPRQDLSQRTQEFLHSLNFAFWVQYCDTELGRRMGVVGPLQRVKSWSDKLPIDHQLRGQIEDCYTASYRMLIEAFEVDNSEPLCHLLAEMCLYDHYLDMGLFKENSEDRDRVVSQLTNLLGQKHPTVLNVRGSIAYTRLLQGRMRAARRIYSELVKFHREVVGEDDIRFVEALHYRGESEYYMTEFAAAAITFTATSADFFKAFGPDRWSYLAAQIWYASAMAHLDQLEVALKIFQSLFGKRRGSFGSHDSLIITIQIGLADVLRAIGRRDKAMEHFEEVLGMRRETCPSSDIYRLDVEIALARTLQEAGLTQRAKALIQEIEEGGGLQSHYERSCQVVHIKGLLFAAHGKTDDAINTLHQSLIQAEPDQNNRALMWMRLDLAKLLRQRNGDGDMLVASSIFDNLVRDISGDCEPGFPDEPDPPRLLAAAENALALLRSRKHTEAKQLLDTEQVEWKRPSDLWLWVAEVVFH